MSKYVKNRIEIFHTMIQSLEQEKLTVDCCSHLFTGIQRLRGHIDGREIKPFIHLIVSLLQQEGAVFLKEKNVIYTNKYANRFSKYASGDEFAVYKARFDDRKFDLHTIVSLLLTYNNLLPNSFTHPFILEIPRMVFKKDVILDETKIDYKALRSKHLECMKTAMNDLIHEPIVFVGPTV